MVFDYTIILEEIVFQYDFTVEHAENIIQKHINNGTYEYLCDLVKNHACIV